MGPSGVEPGVRQNRKLMVTAEHAVQNCKTHPFRYRKLMVTAVVIAKSKMTKMTYEKVL